MHALSAEAAFRRWLQDGQTNETPRDQNFTCTIRRKGKSDTRRAVTFGPAEGRARIGFSGSRAGGVLFTMMLVPCYLAPSEIEGLGVFSSVPIKRGDIVWRFDDRFDRLIAKSEIADAAPHLQIFFERYCYDMPGWPDHLALDADEGRFMNHADLPNLDFSGPDKGIAKRNIPAGVELTCDYREFTSGALVFQDSRHMVAKPTQWNSHAAD